MISIVDYIKALLPNYIIDQDSLKDGGGKGFLERYLEIFGLELDEFYYSEIDKVPDQVNPLISLSQYLDYIGYTLGDIPNITSTEPGYRRFLSYIISIYKIKGTIGSFKAILYTLGLEVTLTEVLPGAVLYDSGVTYDEAQPISYDINCEPCSDYDLDIIGVESITSQLYNAIISAVKLVEPINADLSTITYNAQVVQPLFIEVTVDGNGDLIYDNANDPSLVLTLDAAGDLIVSGPNEDQYYLDDNGDLIYLNLV